MLEKSQIVGGRYQVEGLLGEGGMATVYRAIHTGTRKPCAIKVLRRNMLAHSSVGEMFVREAQVGALMGDSPYIIDVFDAAIDDALGVPFLVMPLLPGEPLDAAIASRGALPAAVVAAIFRQLALALTQAHAAGVVHRDLKPSNIFLCVEPDGSPRIKILDFGIAKFVEAAASSQTATHIGTPAYSAPEQLAPLLKQLAAQMGVTVGKSITAQTDVWPLGLIAYECLTGAAPGQIWGGCSSQEMPLRSLGATPVPSHEAGPASVLLPDGFDDWFARCLEKDPDRRWASAHDACAALCALLGASSGLPVSDTARASLPAPPRPTLSAATSLGVFTFAADTSGASLPSSSLALPRSPATGSPLRPSPPSSGASLPLMTTFGGALGTHIPVAQTMPPPVEDRSRPAARRLPVIAAAAVAALAAVSFFGRGAPAGGATALAAPLTAQVAASLSVAAASAEAGPSPSASPAASAPASSAVPAAAPSAPPRRAVSDAKPTSTFATSTPYLKPFPQKDVGHKAKPMKTVSDFDGGSSYGKK